MKRQELISQFGKELKPLYKEMMDGFQNINDYWLFCAQWGKYYPLENSNEGIVIYGRSVNEWEDVTPYALDSMFAEPHGNLFNREDQMEWMWSKHNPFVNLMRMVAQQFYPEEWHQHIAWSNVYKVSPSYNINNGKPTDEMKEMQNASIVKILDTELHFFSPKIAIFVTGAYVGEKWDAPIFETEHYHDLKYTDSIKWGTTKNGKSLVAQTGTLNGTLFIRTDRPEYNSVTDEANAMNSLTHKFNDNKNHAK